MAPKQISSTSRIFMCRPTVRASMACPSSRFTNAFMFISSADSHIVRSLPKNGHQLGQLIEDHWARKLQRLTRWKEKSCKVSKALSALALYVLNVDFKVPRCKNHLLLTLSEAWICTMCTWSLCNLFSSMAVQTAASISTASICGEEHI